MTIVTTSRLWRALPVAGATLLLASLLGACSASEPSNDSETGVPDQTSSPAPTFAPAGGAAENAEFAKYTLKQAIREGMSVDGQSTVNTLVAAGFDKSLMQVSFDRSKTNLTADSIYTSVRFGDQCLLTQVVADDKTVHVSVQPAIGPEKTICLVGETRPIDW